jgi:hypothetical protein
MPRMNIVRLLVVQRQRGSIEGGNVFDPSWMCVCVCVTPYPNFSFHLLYSPLPYSDFVRLMFLGCRHRASGIHSGLCELQQTVSTQDAPQNTTQHSSKNKKKEGRMTRSNLRAVFRVGPTHIIGVIRFSIDAFSSHFSSSLSFFHLKLCLPILT